MNIKKLRRTRSGPFREENSHTLQVEVVKPVERAVGHNDAERRARGTRSRGRTLQKMIELNRGIVIKLNSVIMERKTYPSSWNKDLT